MANQRRKKQRRRRRAKKIILLVEILIILAVVIVGVSMFMPNAKVKFAKAFVSCAPGRMIVSGILKDDYENNIQDKNFAENDIAQNEGLQVNDDYTNIALFGGDSRDGELGDETHSDSIIIVSINKKTGDMKMVSVFRDTALKYVANDKTHYDKATNAMYAGGTQTTINMLNENLDLNITDYAIINFAGLANVVDALGGMDVTITDDERQWINNYLGETREVTGMTTPNVEVSGNVHLTGLQTTAYCRIRAVAFHEADGTVLSDDFGRAARQRYVLEHILQSVKSAGAKQLLDVAKSLLGESSGDDKFISSSMSFDEILDLMPAALECNLAGSSSFPTKYTTGYIGSADCILVKGLSNNVSELHQYLFDEQNYQPTDAVETINTKLIKLTGVKP